MKPLGNMVEEKGIEPSTFALRMLPRHWRHVKSITYERRNRPYRATLDPDGARTGHSDRECDAGLLRGHRDCSVARDSGRIIRQRGKSL